MEKLIELVKDHRFTRNQVRTNLDNHPNNTVVDARGCKWLKKGPYSNTLRNGPILEHVKTILPTINAVCLNRKRAKSPPIAPHYDRKNVGNVYTCFWGDFDNSNNQGALVTELGDIYSEKFVFHGPYRASEVRHWVLPHSTGTRFSCIAFQENRKL